MTTERDGSGDKVTSIYLVVIGLLLLGAAWIAIDKRSDPTAATLSLLGAGALVLAPFVSRIEGRIRIGPIEMKLRERLVDAAIDADQPVLQGVLTFLESDDISVELRDLPSRLAGHRLTDPEFAHIRPDMHLQVIAVKLAGENRWRSGGEIADLTLPAGSKLLIVGPRESLRTFG